MRAMGIGHVVFALAVAGLGVLSLLSGDFALNWQPVPDWVPFREPLAYASGVILVIFGLGLLVRRMAVLSAFILTVDFLIWLLLLRVPLIKSLFDPGGWLGFGETALLVVGAWTLLVRLSDKPLFGSALFGPGSLRTVRILFGVALPLIGQSHIVYAKATVGLIPTYVPYRLGFAYFTGAAHAAAGIAVLASVVPRLAATLEGIMMGLFGLMVWVPLVAAAPTTRLTWTALMVSFAYAAASLIVAESYKSAEPSPQAA